MFRQLIRTATVSVLLVMTLSACATVHIPYRIVSFSSQTTAIVHQLGIPEHRVTRAHGAHERSDDLPYQLMEWVSADQANAMLLVAVAGDLPADLRVMASHPRVSVATYSVCTIVDVFKVYEDLGERLSLPNEAAAEVRRLSTALGRISGSTLGRARPLVVVASSPESAHTGTGLVGDIVEIGGGEHLLEHDGSPCSAVELSAVEARTPEVLIDAQREPNTREVLWNSTVPPRVVALPQLVSQLENLELEAAARAMRAALFPDINP